MLNRGQRRLQVNLDEIRNHNRELADGLLNTPFDYLPTLDRALTEVASTLRDRARHEEITDDTVGCYWIGLDWIKSGQGGVDLEGLR